MVETLIVIAVIFGATFVVELLSYYLPPFLLWLLYKLHLLPQDIYQLLIREWKEGDLE